MSEKVKLIIEIPKYYWKHPQDYTCLAECVRRGTILPKEHEADVLDKLRAEIEQIIITTRKGVSFYRYVSAIDVLQIIDKYRAEIEPQESEG